MPCFLGYSLSLLNPFYSNFVLTKLRGSHTLTFQRRGLPHGPGAVATLGLARVESRKERAPGQCACGLVTKVVKVEHVICSFSTLEPGLSVYVRRPLGFYFAVTVKRSLVSHMSP